MSSRALRDAVNELGKFFGIRSADAFLQAILGTGVMPSPVEVNIVEQKAGGIQAELIGTLSGAGDASPSVATILERIEGAVLNDEERRTLNTNLCITVADNDMGADPNVHPLNATTVQVPGGIDEWQGMFNPKNKKFYTVDDYAVSDLSNKPGTKLHVFQVWPAVGNVSNSDTDVVALFMNSIPTLEMSRAVPFVDITVLTKDTPGAGTPTRPMSLGRFLLGADMSEEEAPTTDIFTAEDPHVAAELERADRAAAEAGEDLPDQFLTAASMEIFTSPQTMVPTNPDGTLRMNRGTGNDDAPLDPFRPLMSLTSLNINVTNSVGAQTFKSADLTLVLHDRSQLGVIAPLVTPGEVGNIKLEITYGWSHPDGSVPVGRAGQLHRGGDADDSNRFADLINSMRVSELFNVNNSDFSFNDDGSVTVNLKLATAGVVAIQTFDVTMTEVVSAYEDLQKITDSIKDQLSQYRKLSVKAGNLNIPTALQRATNANSASVLKRKEIQAIQKYVKGIKNTNLKSIGESINKIEGAQGKLSDSKATAINGIIERIKTTPDPFLRPVGDFAGEDGILATSRVTIRTEEVIVGKKASTKKQKAMLTEFGIKPLEQKRTKLLLELEREGAFASAPGDHSDPFQKVYAAQGGDHRLHQIQQITAKLEEMYKELHRETIKKTLHHKGDVSNWSIKHKQDATKGRSVHVSLGKILSYFLGQSMAASEQFDEVQMIFYAFNESASFLHDCNIAQFPINIKDLEEQLKKQFSNTGRMTIGQFMQMLDTTFVRDPGAPGYGMTGTVYQKGHKGRKEDKNKKSYRALIKTLEKKKKDTRGLAIQDAKAAVLAKAYGLEEGMPGADFKMPHINLRIEAVPMQTKYDGPPGNKSILKIHVHDLKCSSAEALRAVLEGFIEDGTVKELQRRPDPNTARGSRHSDIYTNWLEILATDMGAISRADDMDAEAIAEKLFGDTEGAVDKVKSAHLGMYIINVDTPSRLKNIFSTLFPTFVYGGSHSNIISAKVATENNPLLAAARMVGEGKKTPGSSGIDPGLPMRITPTSLTLDTLGCPNFAIGQNYFVDFMTNTTADNFYNVFEVSHSIEPGKFTTSIKMNTLSTFGKWESTLDNLKKLITVAGQAAVQQGQGGE